MPQNAMIGSNFLKMSGFSSKNVWYPRYQDTGFLQLCFPVVGLLVSANSVQLNWAQAELGKNKHFWESSLWLAIWETSWWKFR